MKLLHAAMGELGKIKTVLHGYIPQFDNDEAIILDLVIMDAKGEWEAHPVILTYGNMLRVMDAFQNIQKQHDATERAKKASDN